MIIEERGVTMWPFDRNRISWEWLRLIIISPIVIKSKDLKRAWVSKWKKLRWSKPAENAKPIKPKWLRVERAISFFRSVSNTVFNPAYKDVKTLSKSRIVIKIGLE